MTISQVLDLNNLPILAYIITRMAINADLIARHISNRQLLVRISKRHDRVDKLSRRRIRLQDLGGVVDDLGALTVAADAEFCVWALIAGLLDQLKDVSDNFEGGWEDWEYLS